MRLLSNIPPRPTDRLREQERAKEGGRRPLISAKAIGDGRHGQTEFTPFNPSLRMVDLVTIRTRNAAGIVTFSVAGAGTLMYGDGDGTRNVQVAVTARLLPSVRRFQLGTCT